MPTATYERIAPDMPGVHPADAAVEAREADARAAQASAVAEHASKIAKEARSAARKAKLEATKLREQTNPKLRERKDLSVDQAKLRLMEAARAIHPVSDAQAAMRDHPWLVVGSALGAGFVTGSAAGPIGTILASAARLSASLVKLGKPIALAAGQYAASRMAAEHAADSAVDEATGAAAVH